MMKNIKLLALFISVLILGCSDSDTVDTAVLEVVSQNIDFTAAGGEGTIVVRSNSSVTAVSSHPDWCTVSVSGTTVTVKTDLNMDYSSRTSRIDITSSGETISLAAHQQGFRFVINEIDFELGWLNNRSKRIEYVSAVGITSVVNNNDWLTYEINDDSTITFEADINHGGNTRKGEIIFYSEGASETVTVEQKGGLYYEDLLGDWILYFTSSTGVYSGMILSLTEEEPGISYRFGTINFSNTYYYDFVIDFDEDSTALAITPGQYLGTYGIYGAYITLTDRNAGYHTWDTSIKYRADVDRSDILNPEFKFYDDGTWGTYSITGMYFYAFSGGAPGTGTGVGNIYYFGNMELVKVDTINIP